MVWDLLYFDDLEEKNLLINQWINDRDVCRTAPATPGLWKIYSQLRIDLIINFESL